MTSELFFIELPRALEHALSAGHPWVYRNHVPPAFAAPSGSWVRLKAGAWSGYALWDAVSPIALRVFSERGVPDAAWLAERVRSAWQLREPIRSAKNSAYRCLFGEGDGLPGLTVDIYGSFAVVVTYADALDVLLPDLALALRATLPLAGIVRRGRGQGISSLWGRMPPRDLIVEEQGVRLHADLYHGQKTGLFLDHRANREYVRANAAGKRVLNLFAYTGAFSLYAALGAASQVTSVDSAAPSMAAARDNFVLNGLDPEAHEFVVRDVFEFLQAAHAERSKFDLVICDPPSFAKSKSQLEQARKAYVRLNSLGFGATRPGGLYAAASCTALVGPEDFRSILAEAAERAGGRFQIIHEAGQPPDHPVMAHHPEGRYLKFMVGRLLERA